MMNGKRRWLYSLLSLVLCIVMLVGTTLAWFSDTVSASGKVEAGKLKIDFQKFDGTDYVSVRDSGENIFDDGNSKVYWEPGMTQILYLAVENLEELPVKYQILIDVQGIDAEDGNFEYALYDGVKGDSEEAAALNATAALNVVDRWKALKKVDGAQTGTVIADTYTAAPEGRLNAKGDVDYFALAVHVNEDAGNEYQNQVVSVDVTVEATQIDGFFGEGPYLGTSVMANIDFEKNDAGIGYGGKSGYRTERIEEADGNWYMLYEKLDMGNLGEFHATAQNLSSLSDYVVYEFDFMVLEEGTQLIIYDSNVNGGFTFGAIAKDGTFRYGNESDPEIVDVEMNKWYSFAVAINYYGRTMDYYLDGKLTLTAPLPAVYSTDNKVISIRFHRTEYGGNFGITGIDYNADPFSVGIDNVRAYDAKAPLDDLGDIVRVVTLTDESVFADETAIKESLDGYVSVHTRSGLVYVNGEKSFLPTLPVEEGGKNRIVTAELATILGVTLPAGTAATMDVEEFFTTVMGKTVVSDTEAVHGGMVIAGDSAYALPAGEEALQDLNNFLFFLRPTDEDILSIYSQSELYNVHPRIQATAEDFARIRQIYDDKSDPDIYNWAQQVIYTADATMDKEPVFYELRDGERLLGVSREVLSKMYAYGMAYQITLDQKYAERGFKELQAVCEFPDWHPSHALDTGEMAAAVAIGYDWLYNALTPEQRRVVEQGIYNNAFYDAMIMYQTGSGYMSSLCYGTQNWNNVVSGGLTMAALATLEVYPEVASRLLQHTIRGSENSLFNYAPDGAWFEGPGYWDYATTYTVKLQSSLETTLGTDFRMSEIEGFSTAARFEVAVQGDTGTYPYGEAHVETVYVPEMFYLSRKFDDPAVSTIVMNKSNGKMGTGEHLALALLWYDPAVSGDISEFKLDSLYGGENGIVLMHDTFETGETTFVGFHAGPNGVLASQLDSGSFIFESDGVRWIEDLGADNYNQPGYYDIADGGRKWQIFMARAEAHSTLVINPTLAQDQEVNSYSPLTLVASKDKGAIATADLTEAYRINATNVLRGLQFTDNRRSLVVRDEITLKNADSNVYSFMMTYCDVEVESDPSGMKHKVTLTKDDKSLTMDIITNKACQVYSELAAPLTQGTIYNAVTVVTATRIAIKFTDVEGDITITTKLTPDTVVNPSSVDAYNVDISTWTIPDGVRPVAPKLDSLVIEGETVNLTGYTYTNYYVEGQLTAVPEILATCSNANVEVDVVKGATLNDVTTITLTDKADSANKSVYTIIFKAVPQPLEIDGKTSIPAVSAVASCTPQSANIAANVIDANKITKWAGDTAGNHITVDIKKVQEISGVAVLFQGAVGRKHEMVISVSEDGNVFTDVWSGWSNAVKTNNYNEPELLFLDPFDFTQNVNARYVRVTINGNNQSVVWTSIAEVVVYKNN